MLLPVDLLRVALGVISKFHMSRTNERTFILEGGGLDPIRCAIDSTKKKKNPQSCCGACRVKSKKRVAIRFPISKARTWSITDVNCAFEGRFELEGAGRHLLHAVRHWVDLHRPTAFEHVENEKKSKSRILLQLFEIVSFLISQWTLNRQGSVPACVRQTTLYMYYMFELVVAKKDAI